MKNILNEFQKIVYDNTTKEEEYIDFRKKYEEEALNSDPILYIGLCVDFYLQRENISKALYVLERFREGKYISLSVEEFMAELKEKIEKEQNPVRKKEVSNKEIATALLSKNREKILFAFQALSTKNIRLFLPQVEKFLSQNPEEDLQRLLLILLVEQKVDQAFTFTFLGKEQRIIPNTLSLPFEKEEFQTFLKKMPSYFLSPDTLEMAENIVRKLAVCIFPGSFSNGMEDEVVFKTIQDIIFSYQGKSFSFESEKEEKLYTFYQTFL